MFGQTYPRFWVCDRCYFLNKSQGLSHGTTKCEIHSKVETEVEDSVVTYGVVYSEIEEHEKFTAKSFTCNNDLMPTKQLENYEGTYLPQSFQESKHTSSKITTERFGKAPAHFPPQLLLQNRGSKPLSVEEQVMFHIQSDKSFANTVIFTKSTNIGLLVRAMQKLGHSAKKIKMKGMRFSYIITAQNNVTFVAIENYLSGSTFNLAKSYGLNPEPNCFPKTFCQIFNLNYSGELPHQDFWTLPTDSIEKKKVIREHVAGLSKEWSMETALPNYVEQKCRLLVQVLVKFLEQCFQIQIMLQKFLKMEAVRLIHPFKSPIVSISSFSYKLLVDYGLASSDLRTVDYTETGIYDHNCSLYEWYYSKRIRKMKPDNVLWGPYLKSEGAFTKFGKVGTPDIYDETERKCYWMNGCR